MMTTLTTSSEGKRNKKTKALNGLLTATAIGLFLEGCATDTAARTCTYNGRNIPCDEYDRLTASPLNVSQAQGGEQAGAKLSLDDAQAVATAVASQESGESSEGSDGDLLASSSETETLESGGVDSVSYADSDEDDAEGGENSAEGENSQEGSEEGHDDVADDVVVAENDDSIVEGGSDVLQGSASADTYVFTEDGGANTIVEVAAEDVVNTLKFEGDYEASDFSFERGSEDGRDLIVTVDTDGDGRAENEITLADYFVSETDSENLYTIMVQINDGEAFTPSVDA